MQARKYEPLLFGKTGPYVAAANSQTRDAHVRDASGRHAWGRASPTPIYPRRFRRISHPGVIGCCRGYKPAVPFAIVHRDLG